MTLSTCPPPEGGTPIGRSAALVGVSALASLFLAACGGDGGGGSSPPPPSPPPVSATQFPPSVLANDATLEAFAFGLPQTEDTEPLTLDLVNVLPTSESEDPIPTP